MKTQDSEILRRSSVFRFLSDDHFGAIEPLLQEEHYDFGDVIVKQDDEADSFYVLTRGRARAENQTRWPGNPIGGVETRRLVRRSRVV